MGVIQNPCNQLPCSLDQTQGLSFKEESKVAADSVVQNPETLIVTNFWLIRTHILPQLMHTTVVVLTYEHVFFFLVIDHYGNRSCYTTHDAHTHKPCKTQHMCIICVCITVYIRYKYTTYMHTCIPCTPCMYTNMYMSTIYI